MDDMHADCPYQLPSLMMVDRGLYAIACERHYTRTRSPRTAP